MNKEDRKIQQQKERLKNLDGVYINKDFLQEKTIYTSYQDILTGSLKKSPKIF